MSWNKTHSKSIEEKVKRLKEANSELRKQIKLLQQPKNCDNCEYESGDNFKTLIECGTDIHICALCKRGTNDYFKLKEQ